MKKKDKKNKVAEEVTTPAPAKKPQVQPFLPANPIEMTPSEELQVYYNEAYMRERQRLNEIFGPLPTEPTVQVKVIQPDYSNYVHKDKYKKLKRCRNAFAVFTVLFAIATVALAVLYLLK